MSIGFKCRGPEVELRFSSFLGYVHTSTTGTEKEKSMQLFVLAEDSMKHTILKFHWCRWFISQNKAHFSTCKKPLNFKKFEQNCRCQN